jgi:hypothetical protein
MLCPRHTQQPLKWAVLVLNSEIYILREGWVIIAFQNALWRLLNAPSLKEGVAETIMRGRETDTNAAIEGALLGAAYGRNALPNQRLRKYCLAAQRLGNLAYDSLVVSVFGLSMLLNSRGVWLTDSVAPRNPIPL